jgi:hypothetical protein
MAMSGIGTIACAVAYLVPLILLIGSSTMITTCPPRAIHTLIFISWA